MIPSDFQNICCYLKEGLRDNGRAVTGAKSINVIQKHFNLSELDLFYDCEQMEYFSHA